MFLLKSIHEIILWMICLIV